MSLLWQGSQAKSQSRRFQIETVEGERLWFTSQIVAHFAVNCIEVLLESFKLFMDSPTSSIIILLMIIIIVVNDDDYNDHHCRHDHNRHQHLSRHFPNGNILSYLWPNAWPFIANTPKHYKTYDIFDFDKILLPVLRCY